MLDHKFKIPGYVLVITGIVFLILYFTIKFRFEMPVFALASTYLKTKYLTTFSTNFADESIFLLLLTGLSLIVFSRERNEKESFSALRYKALVRTIITDIVFLLLSVIFIYGAGFLVILLVNVFFPFIVYQIIFQIMKIISLRKEQQ
jgi:hypothetical protein